MGGGGGGRVLENFQGQPIFITAMKNCDYSISIKIEHNIRTLGLK